MELIYFPVSGRALTSRLLMKSKGVNFTDTQISFADWATSGIKDTMPLGACPVLKVGDEVFCQTKAIEAYLAKKFGYLSEDPVDQLKAEMYMETQQEILLGAGMKAMSEVAGEFEPDETNKFLLKENTPENRAKRAKRIGQLCGAALEAQIPTLEKILDITQTNPDFVVGNQNSLADFYILGLFFTAIDPFFGESYEFLREKAPRLARIADKLLENPEIKKYETFLRENSVPHTGMGGAY